ncbi:unnamed protein product [Amoebophrya sp. A120]|nr:unnamed protein product [Amoebophrya sp. A120]|eukprot:GSA120T00019432001.1
MGDAILPGLIREKEVKATPVILKATSGTNIFNPNKNPQQAAHISKMSSNTKPKPLTEVEGANGAMWKINKKLGSGSFGEVFLATQTSERPLEPGTEVAVKVEGIKTAHPQLAYEARLLSLLRGNTGISQVYHSGMQKGYNVLVMELLGYSLEDLVVMCHGKFSLKTCLLVMDQLLSRIEDLHAAGFIHRDIKPENFLLGRADKANVVHIIDFGLSKKYCDGRTQDHIPYKDNKSLTGTARYASINAHRGVEQSRRDDLEAIGHMMFYFLRGNLPWQGLPAKTKDEKYRKIKEKKIETSIDLLCSGFPEEFATYLQYVRSLRFQDRPDYAYLRGLFQERYIAEGYHNEPKDFDWTAKLAQKQANEAQAAQSRDNRPPPNSTNALQSRGGEPANKQDGVVAQPKSRMRKLFALCSKG